MKKDFYVVFGAVALAGLLFFLGAKFYNSSQAPAPGTSPASEGPLRVDQSLLIKDYSPSQGPTMARVVLVEFLDPECESCRAMHPIVKRVLADYQGRLRYVVRYMPYHGNSELAARWLEAAREQDKYWEALDVIFQFQPAWGDHHSPRPDLIPSYLKSVGVDVAKATKAKDKVEFGQWVQNDKADGEKAGVMGTPSFFVNGRRLDSLGEAPLRQLIEEELAGTR